MKKVPLNNNKNNVVVDKKRILKHQIGSSKALLLDKSFLNRIPRKNAAAEKGRKSFCIPFWESDFRFLT